jgi:hypothetical protein
MSTPLVTTVFCTALVARAAHFKVVPQVDSCPSSHCGLGVWPASAVHGALVQPEYAALHAPASPPLLPPELEPELELLVGPVFSELPHAGIIIVVEPMAPSATSESPKLVTTRMGSLLTNANRTKNAATP